MSLDKRRIRTKIVTIKGTQKDFEALADVLQQASNKLNIDLYPADKDIPGRITVKTGKVQRIIYPRMDKALKEFASGIVESTDTVVNFGDVPITGDPDEIVRRSPTLRQMEQIATGKHMGIGSRLVKEDTMMEMETMIDTGSRQTKNVKPLTEVKPKWVYASALTLHEGEAPTTFVPKDLSQLDKLKKYPPDLNKSDFWSFCKTDYYRAYFVLLRVDKTLPMSLGIRTKPGEWDKWVSSRPVPDSMRLFKHRPPRNFGEMLERYSVYVTARTFGLRDAYLAPVFAGKSFKEKVGSKMGFTDKIFETEPLKSMEKGGSEYPTFYAFVVVGRGRYKTIGLGEEKVPEALDLPGFE